MKQRLTAALVAVVLSTSQLSLVTAGAEPVNGVGAPYSQAPIKGVPNVVKGKGAIVCCQRDAIYHNRGKK